MAKEKRPRQPDDDLQNAFEEAALHDYPNPDRIGCPGDEVLKAIALKKLPMRDPAITHVGHCSPCFADLKRIREQLARRVRLRRVAAIAAAVVLVIATVTFIWRAGFVPSGDGQPEQTIRAQADLRPFIFSRSDETPGQTGPQEITLSRAHLTLDLLLRPGSELGTYDVHVLDDPLKSVRTARGEATLREGVTVLTTNLNLRQLAPGKYTLAVRPVGFDWRYYPVRLR